MEKSSVMPQVVVTRSYSEGKIVTKEESESLPGMNTKVYPQGVPLAEVMVSTGLTLSLGNYEFVRTDVSIKLPCIVEEIEECYNTVQKLVEEKITETKKCIQEYKKSMKG